MAASDSDVQPTFTKNDVLGAEALHEYRTKRVVQNVLPESHGQKLCFVKTDSEAGDVEASRNSLFDSLKARRVCKAADLCKAEYDERTETIALMKQYGKMHQNMGYISKNGSRLLYPEEAVFLLDSGVLELLRNGIPLSLDQAISTVLLPRLPWEQYLVYGQLVRSGFIVVRYRELPETPGDSGSTRSEDLHSPRAKRTRQRDQSELSPSRDDLPISEWNFARLHLPDDRGSSLTTLATPNFDHLPVLIEYNESRRRLDRRSFSAGPFRCVPETRRDAFHRPSNWQFVQNVQELTSWKEFKLAKSRLINEESKDRSFRVTKSKSCSRSLSEKFEIVYDVHLANSRFSLTCSAKPHFRLIITKADEAPPSVEELSSSQPPVDQVPLYFAVVDAGRDVLFFSLDCVRIPDLFDVARR